MEIEAEGAALAYADLGKFDDAWRDLGETMTAIETSK